MLCSGWLRGWARQEEEQEEAQAPAVDEGSSLLTDHEQAEALGQDGLTPRLANGSAGGPAPSAPHQHLAPCLPAACRLQLLLHPALGAPTCRQPPPATAFTSTPHSWSHGWSRGRC